MRACGSASNAARKLDGTQVPGPTTLVNTNDTLDLTNDDHFKIDQFMTELKLQKYTRKMIEKGWDDLGWILKKATDSEVNDVIDATSMLAGHAARFKRAVSDQRQQPPKKKSRASTSPLGAEMSRIKSKKVYVWFMLSIPFQ